MSSNLFDIGVSGLNAAQWGLTTTGQNISNAATPGYTLESPVYQESSGQYTTSGFAGQGVTTATVARSYSDFLTKQLNSSQSNSSSLNTYYSMLSQLNNLVGDPTTGIGAGITSYFTGLQSIANSPGTTATRQTLMSSAQTLSDQMNAAATTYNQLRDGVNQSLSSAVSQVNSYAKQIADLNVQIASASSAGQPPNQLLDQRDLAVSNLSQLVSVQVTTSNGGYNVSFGNGQPLVAGSSSYALTTAPSPSDPSELSIAYASPDGSTQTAKQTQYLPDSMFSGGGTIGGLLDFRSQSLDPAQAKLGAIATSFATQLNNQNELGIDLNGNPGGALFSTGSPTVYANARNSGNATLNVSIADGTQPPTGDYSLGFDGTNYTLTDRSSGAVVGQLTASSTGAVSGTIGGMNISIASGSMSKGDSFTILPTRGSLDNFSLSSTNPSAIAAASPAVASAATGNTGVGKISAATVTAGYSMPKDINLKYDATTGTMTADQPVTLPDNTVVPAGTPFAYDSNKGLTISNGTGVSATISGTPSTGDSFTIAINKGGTSDGSNALAMANLGTAKSMNGGTDTLTSSYANFVNQIGNQTNALKASSTSATAVLNQATSAQQAVSGVNLNEEAANLIQYQQLYQANSKVIQTASSLFQTLLGIFN
ncbi:flagellar hook-associated protein FlgK [Caballeronia sordidicola]|uniref:Flagellar hook-associated protein 1 n=1 Tax=Caballeronia sordidicola TaxID=196367 RepID=A0A158FEN8_CABSO|nr:flagellar hook-associated protein FlgK [Caballeronia sordidicola]SAL18308.1 flagellar hook-associated protein FlgK [Caballeronia sordidicola]